MKLRPHHIFCIPFTKIEFPSRGAEFDKLDSSVKRILTSQSAVLITVVEGIDDLCRLCPNCVDNRCASPEGDETVVRKWDSILMTQTGTDFYTTKKAKEWQALANSKIPYKVCRKCRLRNTCKAGDMVTSG